jgi:uncharacterized protein (DUF2141 family)
MRKIFSIYLLIILITSCAQQVIPTGGIKDDKAPIILSHAPENKSTQFKSNQITIKFNEYITIKDAGQIIVSPFLKDKPKIESNGKQINIEFLTAKPQANTTYTINFANSISDVNEGNILNNYSYVFSTGNYLDSNSITGRIFNSQTTKEEKDILIALYQKQTFTDTSIYKNYPNYFTKSNEKGRFSINNLPADTFQLIAFKDANADNKYQKTEEIAFNDNFLIPSLRSDSMDLKLFKNPLYKANTLLDTLSKQRHIYQFIVYKPTGIQVKSLNHSTSYQSTLIGKNDIDTIQLFLPESKDTTTEIFEIKTADTSYFISLKTKAKSKLMPLQTNIVIPDKPLDSIKIISNFPINDLIKTKLEIVEDTNKIDPNYFKQTSPFEWVIYYSYKENKSYSITLKDSAYTDHLGRYNKSTNNSFITKSEKDYGTMLLTISPNNNDKIIVQLIELKSAEEVKIQEWKYPLPIETHIKYLKPGNYQFKIIEDLNNNGTWDTGDYTKKIQAEPIFYDKTIISIKAYWDIEQGISIDNIINN